MKKFTTLPLIISLLIVTSIFPETVFSQIQYGGTPFSKKNGLDNETLNSTKATFYLSQEQEAEKQLKRNYEPLPGEPMHAGFVVEANVDPLSSGTWQNHGDSLWVWQILIESPGAKGLGLVFENFLLDEDASIFIYNTTGDFILGSFTHENNNPHQVLSTQLVPGDALIVEYQEKINEPSQGAKMQGSHFQIESLFYVSLGVADLSDNKNLGSSGPCQVDINCPEGDLWQREKRGVARMLMRTGNSLSWCSGSLVNNTGFDGTPYFLTAAHCGSNANWQDYLQWQFYFNFERPGCSSTTGTPAYNVLIGANFISEGELLGGSDFKLLLLETRPPLHWRPYYNGWNRENIPPNGGVGIHHPRGDSKKISTFTMTPTSAGPIVSGQQMADNSTWRVTWSQTDNGHGVVEGGSSGSPMFNSNGLIVGTLTGGSTSCTATSNADFYGKMSYHWDQNSTYLHEQLEPYLDPYYSGVLEIGGFDPNIHQYPSPGFVSVSSSASNENEIKWYQPGESPNNPGWRSYTNFFVDYSIAGPERATVFDAHALDMSYPVTVSKLSHIFLVESGTNNQNEFRFKIYDSWGSFLVYQSPVLEAESLVETVYELTSPITFNDKFYVVVQPVHSSRRPASALQKINLGNGISFNGGPESWDPAGDNNNQFVYLTKIYVDGDQEKSLPPFDKNNNKVNQLITQYKIYKNNDFIDTFDDLESGLIYVDQSTNSGTDVDSYYVTAVYSDEVESAPSNIAYIFHQEFCNTLVNTFPYAEDVEANDIPDCWENKSDEFQWQAASSISIEGTDILPYSGDNFLYADQAQGEAAQYWLVSPPFDISDMEKPALSFWFNSLHTYDPGKMLAVYVSSDNGSFNKLWQASDHPQYRRANELSWLKNVIEISRFKGKDFRFAFLMQGTDNVFAAVDLIEIYDGNDNMSRLNLEAFPLTRGEVYGDNLYIAGQKVTVQAFPNVGYHFHYWLIGDDIVSYSNVYSFIMPDEDLTMRAFFSTEHPPVSNAPVDNPSGGILAFPNPTQGEINLHFQEERNNVSIQVYNINGSLVREIHKDFMDKSSSLRFDLNDQPAGLFFISVTDNKSRQVIKINLVR